MLEQWMKVKRLVARGVLLSAMAFAGAAGCDDVEFNWGAGRSPQRPTREGSWPAAPPAESHVPASAPVTERPPSEKTPAEKPKSAGPGVGVYQLALLSQAAPGEGTSTLRYVRLEHASGRQVGEVLRMLYPPSGPSGTEHRYTLVYPSSLEWRLAGEAAPQLDIPAGSGGGAEGQTGAGAYRVAIGLIYGINIGSKDRRERLRQASETLELAMAAGGLSRFQRWAAAMIAGTIAAEYLSDYERVEACFAAAERTAEPGSFEQLAALYARAGASIQNGRPEVGRQLLETVIAQFGAFRGTEVFDRANRRLAELNRRKP